MDKVFEMGRQFRNEGADSSHNPEFTSLEMYQTYSDYQDMRVLTQEIMQEAAIAAFGEPVARRMQPDGTIKEYDLSGEWRHITVVDAVSEKLGEHIHADTPIEEMRAHAARHNIEIEQHWTWGAVLEALYEELCEDSTELPTFYMDFPKEIAPLTKAHRDDPRFAEKWDLVCWGAEQGTAYSELNDPVDQRARFFAQSLLAAAGDLEAMAIDDDFLTALRLRHAADRWPGHGHRPAGDDPHRPEHPRDDPVPDGQAAVGRRAGPARWGQVLGPGFSGRFSGQGSRGALAAHRG